MKVLVTGATGFVGRHLVSALLARGHEVVAVARDPHKVKLMPWDGKVIFAACDIHAPGIDLVMRYGKPDVVMHLAWPGLPNYKGTFHVAENLPGDEIFLRGLVDHGVDHLLVTGTCLEYGLQQGVLSEDVAPKPVVPYAAAKDALRQRLELLRKEKPFVFQWVRLFYMYGQGQNPNSLMAQLDRAIDEQRTSFDMSGGEQLRDYLPVETVARYLVLIAENTAFSGIVNCCSGCPVSVRQMVEQRLRDRHAGLKLNLGVYPYPDYEPMEFWGDNTRLKQLMQEG